MRFKGFRVEHLRHVGWQAYRVGGELRELVRARAGGDHLPARLDGLVDLVPVLEAV